MTIMSLLVPLLTMNYCYARIFYLVHKSKKRINVQTNNVKQGSKVKSSDMKLIKMTLTILAVFLLFPSPYLFLNLFDPMMTLKSAHLLSYVLGWTNSTLNPIIYVAMNQQFREALFEMFPWLSCKKSHKPSKQINIPVIQETRTRRQCVDTMHM